MWLDQAEDRAATHVVIGERDGGVPEDPLTDLERVNEVGDGELSGPVRGMPAEEQEVLGRDLAMIVKRAERGHDVLAHVLTHVAHDPRIGVCLIRGYLGEDRGRGRVHDLVGAGLELGQDAGQHPLIGGFARCSVDDGSGHAVSAVDCMPITTAGHASSVLFAIARRQRGSKAFLTPENDGEDIP